MLRRANLLFEKLLYRKELRRWRNAALRAPDEDLERLRGQRARARHLQDRLSQLLHVAESRLALPHIGSQMFQRPGGTLWAWRPQVWTGPIEIKGQAKVGNKTSIGDEVALYHNCDLSEITYRQIRNTREADLAPFALRLEVFGFHGDFLSLAIDLPEAACSGMQKRHLVRLSATIEIEKPLEVFARLNIKHGPNTAQVVEELPIGKREIEIEFDLAYSDLNEKRISKMWLDLIFEKANLNQIVIRDLTMCRYPRAEI